MAELTPDEKAELRKAADAATPGPWRECGAERDGCQCCLVWSERADTIVAAPRVHVTSGAHRENDDLGEGFTVDQGRKNARYIARANPATILALLDENARLEAEVSELVRQSQASQTALAQGWAKLREEKRSTRELAWDEGRNSADERNPYR